MKRELNGPGYYKYTKAIFCGVISCHLAILSLFYIYPCSKMTKQFCHSVQFPDVLQGLRRKTGLVIFFHGHRVNVAPALSKSHRTWCRAVLKKPVSSKFTKAEQQCNESPEQFLTFLDGGASTENIFESMKCSMCLGPLVKGSARSGYKGRTKNRVVFIQASLVEPSSHRKWLGGGWISGT